MACGQANGNLHRDVLLSNSAAFIWKNLEKDISHEELIKRFQEEYECTTPEELDKARDTVLKFVDTLDHSCLMFHPAAIVAMRDLDVEAIPTDANSIDSTDSSISYFNIAGINLIFHAPTSLLPDELKPWGIDKPEDGPTMNIFLHKHDDSALTKLNLERTLTTFEIQLLTDDDTYYASYPLLNNIFQAQMDHNGENVHIFYDVKEPDLLKQELLECFGPLFFYKAQKNGLFAIHSASILYKDKVWLFSAQTGVGKSTHAHLWVNNLGVSVFNGDINLLKLENGKLRAIGLPWCGTSGEYHKGEVDLGGIILIERDQKDNVVELTKEEQTIALIHRLISPMWDRDLGQLNVDFAKEIPGKALVCKLQCTMEKTAMDVMKTRIDSYLE